MKAYVVGGGIMMACVALLVSLRGWSGEEGPTSSGPSAASPLSSCEVPMSENYIEGSSCTVDSGRLTVRVSIDGTAQQWLAYGDWDPRTLTVLNRTWDTNAWIDSGYEFTVAFDLQIVRASKRDWFYLAGVSDSGETVIEKWKRKLSSVPAGGQPIYTRTELYRGTALSSIKAMGVDPDNRFLLFVHGTPAILSRMDLGSGHPISFGIYSASTIPDLESVRSMFARQHLVLGRLWTLDRVQAGSSSKSVLIDSDNDTHFETVVGLLDYVVYINTYPSEDFSDDFVTIH